MISSVVIAAPLHVVLETNRAKKEIESGKLNEAQKRIEKTQGYSNKNAEIYYNSATIKLIKNNPVKSEKLYKKSLKKIKESKKEDVFYNLATAQMRSKKYDEAIENLKKVLIKNPEDHKARVKLQHLLQIKQKNKTPKQKNKEKDKDKKDKDRNKNKEDESNKNKNENKNNLKNNKNKEKEEANSVLDQLSQKEKEAREKYALKKTRVRTNEKDW